MSLSRAVSSGLSCHTCRSASLRCFISQSSGNGSIQAARPFASTAGRNLPRTPSARSRTIRENLSSVPETEPGFEFLEPEDALSTTQLSPNNQDMPTHEARAAEELDKLEELEAKDNASAAVDGSIAPSSTPASADPTVPWYLRHHAERAQQTSLSSDISSREALPDLPVNPPPLLQTLLEYLSITSGLDHLSLFDLRHLDPPPALGPNLIMLMCTARSEKHLHVSADRFCRHLRREYGLKADADGLLGRNELKIKLRRKAKRMKMMANVGAREVDNGNIDDGIRTGWICVTVGKIEAHPDDRFGQGLETSAGKEGFVGFRDVKPGVNVVVQMFTEEKREEVGLETLWGGVLKSFERNMKPEAMEENARHLLESDEAARGGDEAVARESALSSGSPSSKAWTSPTKQWNRPTSRSDPFPSVSTPGSAQQMRRLHTVGLRSYM